MSVYLLEETTMPALDALDRDRTVVILTVSPLEEHGPHLPVGVDALTGRHLAESVAARVVGERPGWSAVLAPISVQPPDPIGRAELFIEDPHRNSTLPGVALPT